MRVIPVAEQVFFVEGAAVNWTIVGDGERFTLIDSGYPGDAGDVLESIERAGYALDGLAAILVTHAHVDHIGSINALLNHRDVPVLTSEREAQHVRRDFLEQAAPLDIISRLWRPRMLPWAIHIIRQGALKDVAVPAALGFATAPGEPLDLPGRPIPIMTPGHTSGHTCYLLPEANALITGDALVTGHPLSSRRGPQMLPDFFHHDRHTLAENCASLARIEAEIILPGHGPLWRGSPAEAVAKVEV